MTGKFGWCLTGRCAGDPSVESWQQCPGRSWNLFCTCECHDKHPPKVDIPPPMKKRPKPQPNPTPKEQPEPPKRRQRRKLL